MLLHCLRTRPASEADAALTLVTSSAAPMQAGFAMATTSMSAAELLRVMNMAALALLQGGSQAEGLNKAVDQPC